MIINEKITAATESFIRYSLLLNPDEFDAVRAKIEPLALHNMAATPKAQAIFTMILDEIEKTVKSSGGGTVEE